MTTTRLKAIAIISMLIDHIGAIFIPGNTPVYMVFRGIGRLAFPIFAFLIVEGFYHTRSVKKYLLRLGSFALISEIPFDLAFYRCLGYGDILAQIKTVFQTASSKNYNNEYNNIKRLMLTQLMERQNIFFTLFLGLLLITLMNRVETYFKKKIFIAILIDILLIAVFCFAAYMLNTDYDYAGILTIASFYILRRDNIALTIALLFIFGYILGHGQLTVSILAVFSMPAIVLYNGKKGKDIKYLFYAFYPVHLSLLFLISLAFK